MHCPVPADDWGSLTRLGRSGLDSTEERGNHRSRKERTGMEFGPIATSKYLGSIPVS